VESQISQQVASVAHTLAVDRKQVFPVSAQKGLVAKINRDAPLLVKSRLLSLEYALSDELIPAKRDIIRTQLLSDIEELTASKQALLSSRLRNVVEQLQELKSLRGKNKNIIEHMMRRIDMEKNEFDTSLVKLQGTRAVFARLSSEVFTSLGMGILKEDIRKTREAMEKSRFNFREAVKDFFERIQRNLTLSGEKTEEVTAMMTVMYRKFSTEHGLALTTPMPFSLDKYKNEIAMIETVYQREFGPAVVMTTRKVVLMQKFFDSIASRVKHCFLHANRDVDAWLKVIMAPLEAQIREHKTQLKQRKQSIERIHFATDTLEEKVKAFEQMQLELEQQKNKLASLELELKQAISADFESIQAAA
jgi:hypothetical protein